MTKPLVILSAGGTGGHLFPAEALATQLQRMGVRVVLATDHRVGNLAAKFPAEQVIEIPSATSSGRSLPRRALAFAMLGVGILKAGIVMRRLKPDAVVGFGGYPTVPPIIAAAKLGIPTIIHEQNAVMGRANRLLARSATLIATGVSHVERVPPGVSRKMRFTGNPIRPAVLRASEIAYAPLSGNQPMRILVFGGSQGARVMSDIVPAAIEALGLDFVPRLDITQQVREEDLPRVREIYARLNVNCDIRPFFDDLPERIAKAHLVVARSGASTVAELAAIGRPSILVPLPGALDQDQAANAQALGDVGAAIVIPQDQFSPQRLAGEIGACLASPYRLTEAANNAKSVGVTDAAERLAQKVMQLVASKKKDMVG